MPRGTSHHREPILAVMRGARIVEVDHHESFVWYDVGNVPAICGSARPGRAPPGLNARALHEIVADCQPPEPTPDSLIGDADRR